MNIDKLSLGFCKNQRLLKPKEYQKVYSSSQRGGSKFFRYHVEGAPTLEEMSNTPRLGITVSKKVSKLAVQRNRIKRIVREGFRQNQHFLRGSKIVITAKPGINIEKNTDLRSDLDELMTKLLRWRKWHTRQLEKHSGD